MKLVFTEGGLSLVIRVEADKRLSLAYFGPAIETGEEVALSEDANYLVSFQRSSKGQVRTNVIGVKSYPSWHGEQLRYETHRDYRTEGGRKVEIELCDGSFRATVHWQFFDGRSIFRSWTQIENISDVNETVEEISSFYYHGLSAGRSSGWEKCSRVSYGLNGWSDEFRWVSQDIRAMGPHDRNPLATNRARLSNAGSWSSKEHLPLGLYENTEAGETYFWQIESSCSWSWEIAPGRGELYLMMQGASYAEHGWFINLAPGERFRTMPVAIGFTKEGFSTVIAELTLYRRLISQSRSKPGTMPVIFNDYMKCLLADPTTEKELPYIAAARHVGAEVYVIDAGWYAQQGEKWWDTVGEWQPSRDRFDGGLIGLLNTVRAHGLIAGLWLELEVMGENCPLVQEWPEECFFQRGGRPVIFRGRYQLDFRHPIVEAHADEVVERLVTEYGVGYIKIDYNIDAFPGTDVAADSPCDGLIQHARAYLGWLQKVRDKYPNLLLENCSSGGMRTDYALLSLHDVHSCTDQTDVEKMARIAPIGAIGVVPEQLTIWCYPEVSDNRERVILNAVNSLIGRMMVSGEIAYLSTEHLDLVCEAVDFYKCFRDFIPTSIPGWPLGVGESDSNSLAFSLESQEGLLIAVWNFSPEPVILKVSVKQGLAMSRSARYYPAAEADQVWKVFEDKLEICLPKGPCARAMFASISVTHNDRQSSGCTAERENDRPTSL